MDYDILVPEDGLTEWISPGFFVPKGDPQERKAVREGKTVVTMDDLRLVLDYTGLNQYVQRPIHPFPSSQNIINQIPSDSNVFCTLDAIQGYYL